MDSVISTREVGYWYRKATVCATECCDRGRDAIDDDLDVRISKTCVGSDDGGGSARYFLLVDGAFDKSISDLVAVFAVTDDNGC